MRPLALKGHDRAITRVRINQEGDLLFSASKGKAICAWYTENGERLGTYDGHNGVVWDVDVSWDTRTLVSASGDQKIMVWDVETGKCRNESEQSSVARSIGFSYSGQLCVFTTQKGGSTNRAGLYVVDLRDLLRPVVQFSFDSPSTACLFSHLDDRVVAGDASGTLTMWDLRNTDDAINFHKPHNGQIHDLQISDDQAFLISSSKDKTAQLHTAADLKPLKKYASNRPVNSASISPTRDHIILGGGEESMTVTQTATSAGQFEARLYHMVFEEEFARFRGHFGPINSLVFHPSGDIVVSGGEDGYVRVQELDQEYKDFQFDIS